MVCYVNFHLQVVAVINIFLTRKYVDEYSNHPPYVAFRRDAGPGRVSQPVEGPVLGSVADLLSAEDTLAMQKPPFNKNPPPVWEAPFVRAQGVKAPI